MDAKLGADMAAADMVAVACRAVDAAPQHMSVESHTEGVFLRVAFQGHVWPSGWVMRKVANGPGFEHSTKGGVSSKRA